MKKYTMLLGAAAAALAMSGVAHAETAFTGNIGLTTDYKFRGISQTEGGYAVQGGFDASNGMFYAGVWASNVDFEEAALANIGLSASTELDVYAGIKPKAGPVTFDLGVIGYFYPGAAESQIGVGELDYFEGYAKASTTIAEKLSIGGGVNYSPEYTGETGNAYYVELNAAYPLTEMVSVSGAVGYQSVDDPSGVFTSVTGKKVSSDDYTTWNVGATATLKGFAFDLRYVDTNIDKSSLFVRDAFTTQGRADGSVIFSVKRAL